MATSKLIDWLLECYEDELRKLIIAVLFIYLITFQIICLGQLCDALVCEVKGIRCKNWIRCKNCPFVS